MLVIGEDTHWHRLSARCHLRKCVSYLIEAPWDVIELEAIELVFQLLDFSVVCNHLGVMAA